MSAGGSDRAPLRRAVCRVSRVVAVAMPVLTQILLVAMLAENGLEGPFGRMATVEFALLMQGVAGLVSAVLLGVARLLAGHWGPALPLCTILFGVLAVEDAVLYLAATDWAALRAVYSPV